MPPLKDKQVCQKCGQLQYCDEHHVLPKGIFGDGLKVYLCKNCHNEFHHYLGFKFLRKKNAQPAEFYLKKYAAWLAGVVILGLFLWLW